MSQKHTRKTTTEEEKKSLRYFHLKPMECFNNYQLPTNRDILQRFFWIQDHEGKLQPKKGFASIYKNVLKVMLSLASS